MYVFDDSLARPVALNIASGLDRVLSQPSRHGPAYELDAELRPEGRKGPMARSLDSFERYYSDWGRALGASRPGQGPAGHRRRQPACGI